MATIGYARRKLTQQESVYSIYEKECLAVVYGCKRFRSFLEHKESLVNTDSEALSWLRNHPRQLGRIGRWILRLAPFKFRIVHIMGSLNVVADCLSRMFEDEVSPVPSGLENLVSILPIFKGASEGRSRM